MLANKDYKHSLDSLIAQICKEGLCNRPHWLVAVWEAVKRFIAANSSVGRQTSLAGAFLSRGIKEGGKFTFSLEPTDSLLLQCSLKYRSQLGSSQQMPSSITAEHLFKHLAAAQKQCFRSDKQLIIRFFYLLISKIKDILRTYRNVEIMIDHFGILRLHEKTYSFTPFTFCDQPNHSPRVAKIRPRPEVRSHSKLAPLNPSASLPDFHAAPFTPMQSSRRSPPLRRRPYFHQVIIQNEPDSIRVCNDLLGAGVDPLTYDYDYSKLADHPQALLEKEFKKAEHALGRFPCVIDRFSRTKGSQLTGTKVGNSIVVRIGSNYSPAVRRYYLDTTTKSIQLVTPEARIRLDDSAGPPLLPATEQEQYNWVLQNDPNMQDRVELRRQMHARYRHYLSSLIPNDCVAPIRSESVIRIGTRVKTLVKGLGRKEGSPLVNALMNEVNKDYHAAYKKAVLDYILRDREEMIRTGILLIFRPIADWGSPSNSKGIVSTNVELEKARKILQVNHILFPECLSNIYRQNEKIFAVEVFKRRRQGEFRPYNILYYIKRNVNQLSQAVSELSEGWVKRVAGRVESAVDLKQQNYHKLKQFFNAVHILMSNKLKELIYITITALLEEFSKFQLNKIEAPHLLIINVTEQVEKVSFIDDIDKVFRLQLLDILDKIVETTRKLPKVESALKLSPDSHIWGLDENDEVLKTTKSRLRSIIDYNYNLITALRSQLSGLEGFFQLKDQIVGWTREPLKVDELPSKLAALEHWQKMVNEVHCYYSVGMVVVDCIELKRKLLLQIRGLRKLIYDSVEERIKQRHAILLARISHSVGLLCKPITSTSNLVELARDLQQVRGKDLAQLRIQIENSCSDLLKLFNFDGFCAGYQLLKSAYQCRKAQQQLGAQVQRNEGRLGEERCQLEKRLRERISQFQAQTLGWLKEVNAKIESFDMRKLYSEYITSLSDFMIKVEQSRQTQRELNAQEEDLRWAPTSFIHATELETAVEPNFQLWQLVGEFDACMKEWKYLQLSSFDIESAEKRMNSIDSRITRLMVRLKNFGGLKVVYELQNDVKEFLVQQSSIIRIFSNPGLKERHWNLFNKRLPLPGYDLKELAFGRIRLLYDYEKNLKVLMSISNQAAKQFEIENEKQQMYDYWAKLSFVLDPAPDGALLFVAPTFLEQQLQVADHHLTKTLILKNSPFSKALGQVLGEWQGWLVQAKKVLNGFKLAQQKFLSLRNIFRMEEVAKLLPIESTEYDSIENIWKSVVKKILEQPRLTDFLKSQKIPDIVEQLARKADFVKNSFRSYLLLKRSDCPRLYFIPECALLSVLAFLSNDTPLLALNSLLSTCFNGIKTITKQQNGFLLESNCDSLKLHCDAPKKGRARFFDELLQLQRGMRQNIRIQIAEMTQLPIDIETLVKALKQYTVTSIFTALEINLTSQLKKGQSPKQLIEKYKELFEDLELITDEWSLKKEQLSSKLLFLRWRCQQMVRKDSITDGFNFQYVQNKLCLSVHSRNINYKYEYVGDEAPIYISLSTDRFFWHIAFSIDAQVAMTIDSWQGQTLRQLALFSGNHLVKIDDPRLSDDGDFESVLMGSLTGNYWIHFVNSYLRLTDDMLAQISRCCQLRQQKLASNCSTVTFKTTEITLTSQMAMFMTIPSSQQLQRKIPDGLLSCSRNISLSPPDLTSIKHWIIEELQNKKLQQIKNYLHIFEFNCPQLIVGEFWTDIRRLPFAQAKNKIKQLIWSYLNFEQQAEIIRIFDEDSKEEAEPKNWSSYKQLKTMELRQGLERSWLAVVSGERTCKSEIISQVLGQFGIGELFGQNKGLNFSFFEEDVSQLTWLQYLQKGKEKLLRENSPLYLYVDCEIKNPQLQALKTFHHLHSLSPEKHLPLRIVLQTHSMASFQPSTIADSALIPISSTLLDQQSIFKEWAMNLELSAQDKVTLCDMQSSFQAVLSIVVKMQRKPFPQGKAMIARRFTQFLEMFLLHLNSRQVERMCEFDREGYMLNSLVYCAYWALGVCGLKSLQAEALKKHLRQTFGQRLELPGQLDQLYLNEENEWVFWENLKEEFSAEKQNMPIYQLWVPTAGNTRLLTIILRLLENGHSPILFGNQSGRSSLLGELSSFQLAPSTLLLDCHKATSTNHLAALARGRLLFGDSKSNLLLVDDLNLPTAPICDLLRALTQRGLAPCPTSVGRLNDNLFKPSVLATWSGTGEAQQGRGFWRFYGRSIGIHVEKFGQGELEGIFRSYLVCLSTGNSESGPMRLQNAVANFCSHTLKAFPSLAPKDLRLLVESVCRLGDGHEEKAVMKHLLAEAQWILGVRLPVQQLTHFSRHLSHYYGKLLGIQLKNHLQLREMAESYPYEMNSMPSAATPEQLRLWMQQQIMEKDTSLMITSYHARFLQRLCWTLKGNKSHVMLVAPLRAGSRSLARMASWLCGLGVLQVGTGIGGLLEQVVKILKTGGKVDECVGVIPWASLACYPQLGRLLQSLLFSPQFHECFGQILMEQIIKCFNSEKKFLKKNVKKSQLIKKIRQKFNSLFHFCICLPRNSLLTLISEFPAFSTLPILELEPMPNQALTSMARQFIPIPQDNCLRNLLKIEEEMKTNWQQWGKSQNTGVLSILLLQQKLLKLMTDKAHAVEEGSQIWTRKIRLAQQKLQGLQKEQKLFQSQHASYFAQAEIAADAIQKAAQNHLALSEEHAQSELQLEQYKKSCNEAKQIFEKKELEMHQLYQTRLTALKPFIAADTNKMRQNPQIVEIINKYNFVFEGKDGELADLASELQKDYFHRLEDMKLQGIGVLGTLISEFKGEMRQIWLQQEQLSKQFKHYEYMLSRSCELAYGVREAEDQLSQLKDDQMLLKQKQEPLVHSYDELKEKMLQQQSIISILKKFEHILRSSEQMAKIPTNMAATALLAAYLLLYRPLLSQEQIPSFKRLLSSRIPSTPTDFLGFLTPQQQLKITGRLEGGEQDNLSILGLEASSVACAAIGQASQINGWLDRLKGRQGWAWLRDEQDLRDNLQRDVIWVVKQPQKAQYDKLAQLLLRPIQIRNSQRVLIVQQEEIVVHENCKVIYLYSNYEQIPLQLLQHSLFALKVYSQTESDICLLFEQQATKQGIIENSVEVGEAYLKGLKEMGQMDQKMHAIIMKMKKQNVVSEIIYKKIQEEGENKAQIQKKIQLCRIQLQNIHSFLQSKRPLISQILASYAPFKQKYPVHSLHKLILQMLNPSTNISSTIQKYLEQLLIPDTLSGVTAEEQTIFEETTFNLMQRTTFLPTTDLTLAQQYLTHLHQQRGLTLTEVNSEELSTIVPKLGEKLVLLVNRTQQLKQLAYMAETDSDRLESLSLLILSLEHLKPPASLASLPTIPLSNMLSLSLSMKRHKQFKFQQPKTPYQQILEMKMVQKASYRQVRLQKEWLGVADEQILP